MGELTHVTQTSLSKTVVAATRDERKAVFLEHLAVCGVVGVAAKAAGIHRKTAYECMSGGTSC